MLNYYVQVMYNDKQKNNSVVYTRVCNRLTKVNNSIIQITFLHPEKRYDTAFRLCTFYTI